MAVHPSPIEYKVGKNIFLKNVWDAISNIDFHRFTAMHRKIFIINSTNCIKIVQHISET